MMMVGFQSLPPELICHVLFLLSPREICRCATTCKAIRDAAHNSVHIQYMLEVYAQGFIEHKTDIPMISSDAVDIVSKMRSLQKLASLWQSDFLAKPGFGEVQVRREVGYNSSLGAQYVKCGVWWMSERGVLFVQELNPNLPVEPSQIWPTRRVSESDRCMIDPLQNLIITVSQSSSLFFAVSPGQNRTIFLVDTHLVTSRLSTDISKSTLSVIDLETLKCKHVFDEPRSYSVFIVDQLAICGDRIVLLYYIDATQELFIQVIDWKRGQVKNYPLHAPGGREAKFRLLDEQTMVIICGKGCLILYTLREQDGSPQRRITYLLPEMQRYFSISYAIHTIPTFQCMAARPGLMPDYVPSLDLQCMVLEIIAPGGPVILVIDPAIFSEQVVQSATQVEIPWSDWGPKYTCCFPHHPTHRISVFGSKMAYALPRDRTPEAGERVEGIYKQDYFYVHIWDFNKRVAARAEDSNDHRVRVRKPGLVTGSCFVGDMFSDRRYMATVCRTPFGVCGFEKLFLEQDRLTLTWSHNGCLPLSIQVVEPEFGAG